MNVGSTIRKLRQQKRESEGESLVSLKIKFNKL
jgi:hypothetical protein